MRSRTVERLGLFLFVTALVLWAAPAAAQLIVQGSQAVLPEIPEPELCRLVEVDEEPEAAARRLAQALTHDLGEGPRRIVRWPDSAVVSIRYQDRIAFNDRHLPRGDFVGLLTQFARNLPVAIDGQGGLPIGSANYRYIRKDYAYRNAEDFAAKAARHLAEFQALGYHDFDAVVEARFLGKTACGGMIAYDAGYRAVGGAVAVRLAYCAECIGVELFGSVPPYMGLRSFAEHGLSTAAEHGQCLMHGLQWSLGLPADASQDATLDLAALLYQPGLAAGMTPGQAEAAIAPILVAAGCWSED